MRIVFLAAVLVVLAATVAAALAEIGRPPSSRIEALGPSRRVLSETQTAFRRAAPSAGVISAAAALTEAGGLRHILGAKDVHYSLIFGRFTDRDLSITDRPAWILTTTGYYVAEGHGRHAIVRPAHHEVNIVIDARTGRYVEGFGD